MKKQSAPSQLERQYQRWLRQLGQTGYLSHGSVQDRRGRQGGGAGYQWTRKVAGKTITVALNQTQFCEMKKAVANYRELQRRIRKMEELSRAIIFAKAPHTTRQKSLSKKVLGVN